MSHHAHAMQTGLSVEENEITVPEMSHDRVSQSELDRVQLLQLGQSVQGLHRTWLGALGLDALGTRIRERTVVHQLGHLIDVVPGDQFRVGEVHRDLDRNNHLLHGDRRITGDHGPGRKIGSLAHEVASDPAGLALEPGHDRFERRSRFAHGLEHSRHVVVHESRDVELQELSEIVDVVGIRIGRDLSGELPVELHDLQKFRREIVF